MFNRYFNTETLVMKMNKLRITLVIKMIKFSTSELNTKFFPFQVGKPGPEPCLIFFWIKFWCDCCFAFNNVLLLVTKKNNVLLRPKIMDSYEEICAELMLQENICWKVILRLKQTCVRFCINAHKIRIIRMSTLILVWCGIFFTRLASD